MASAGFESTEESVTLSNAPCQIAYYIDQLMLVSSLSKKGLSKGIIRYTKGISKILPKRKVYFRKIIDP